MNPAYRLSRFHVVSPPVGDQKQAGRLRRVLFGTRKAKAHLIDDAAWAALAAGAWDALPREVRDALVESDILVPADEDELQTILDENAAAARDDRSLYLVVQPTAWCQLGCTYCGQRHTQEMLGAENQNRLVERVRQGLASGRYACLQVCWFGGEPLAGLTIMRTLSRRFRAAAADYGCAYDAKMVTNGLLLTPEIAEEVVREMATSRIEVTIDGTAEYHDRRRPAKNGAGTFDRIFANVVALLERKEKRGQSPFADTARGQAAVDGANGDSPLFSPPALSIRCNVDPQNRAGVRPLLERFAAAGVQGGLESFYVAPVFNWGNDAGQQNVTREEFARWEVEWFVAMFKLGFPVAVLPQREKTGCLAMKPDAELVDPHGVLFKCSEVPLVPAYEQPALRNSLGCAGGCATNRYAVGDLERGIDPERFAFRDFSDRIRRGEYPCHECALLPSCGGYCPKKWDDGDVPCPAFKYNIEQRLLLAYAIGRLGTT
jgi:uncharacterized protein